MKHGPARLPLGLAMMTLGAALQVALQIGYPATESGAAPAVTLVGQGGTFASPIVNKLEIDAGSADASIDATYNELPGVDGARDEFAAGRADFAVSEFPLTADQAATARHNGREFAYVPFAAQAVALGFILVRTNDIEIKADTLYHTVRLSVPTLADMFTLGLNQWSDERVVADNAGEPLATVGTYTLTLVFSAEASAATAGLIRLFLDNPEARATWNAYAVAQKKAPDTVYETWVANNGVPGADRGLAQAFHPQDTRTGLPQTNPQFLGQGYLGPIPMAWVVEPWDIPTVSVQNAAGSYVAPTSASMTAALDDAILDPATGLVTFVPSATNADAYAIPALSYLVVPTTGLSPGKATSLAAFIRFVLGEAGQADVAALGGTPVTTAMKATGLQVADRVAAQAGTAPTTSSSTTTTTATATAPASSTTTTGGAPAVTATTGGGTATTATTAPSISSAQPAVREPASDDLPVGSGVRPAAVLPVTGPDPRPLLAAGSALVLGGEAVARRSRRRKGAAHGRRWRPRH